MVMSDFVSRVVHAALSPEWMMEPTRSDPKRNSIKYSTCHLRPPNAFSHRLMIIAAIWRPGLAHLSHPQLQQDYDEWPPQLQAALICP